MNENGENLVLEQLRSLKDDLRTGFAETNEKIDHLSVKVDGHTAILIGLGKYIHDIDHRVEHIEEKLGIEQ